MGKKDRFINPSKIVLHQRGSHKKVFKLMQANVSDNIIIGGFFQSNPSSPPKTYM